VARGSAFNGGTPALASLGTYAVFFIARQHPVSSFEVMEWEEVGVLTVGLLLVLKDKDGCEEDHPFITVVVAMVVEALVEAVSVVVMVEEVVLEVDMVEAVGVTEEVDLEAGMVVEALVGVLVEVMEVVVVVVVVVGEAVAVVETVPGVGNFVIMGPVVLGTHVSLPMKEQMEEAQKDVEVVVMIVIEREIGLVIEIVIVIEIKIAILTEIATETGIGIVMVVDIAMVVVEVFVTIFVRLEVVDLEMVASLLMSLINNGVLCVCVGKSFDFPLDVGRSGNVGRGRRSVREITDCHC